MKSNQKYIAVPILETALEDQDWVLASDGLAKECVIVKNPNRPDRPHGIIISDSNCKFSIAWCNGDQGGAIDSLRDIVETLHYCKFTTLSGKRILTESPEPDYILLKDVPDGGVILECDNVSGFPINTCTNTDKILGGYDYFYLKPID